MDSYSVCNKIAKESGGAVALIGDKCVCAVSGVAIDPKGWAASPCELIFYEKMACDEGGELTRFSVTVNPEFRSSCFCIPAAPFCQTNIETNPVFRNKHRFTALRDAKRHKLT